MLGHWKTAQTQIRRRVLRRLIWVCAVFQGLHYLLKLQEVDGQMKQYRPRSGPFSQPTFRDNRPCSAVSALISLFLMTRLNKTNPVSIRYKSIAGRYRPVSYPDGPITARYRFIKNASWEVSYFLVLEPLKQLNIKHHFCTTMSRISIQA